MFKTINKNILFIEFINKRRKPDRRTYTAELTDDILFFKNPMYRLHSYMFYTYRFYLTSSR
jgi:hypothetical protein